MVAVTPEDEAYFAGLRVSTDLIPNGFYAPSTPPLLPHLRPRSSPRLLFIGSLDYSANFDGLRWLAQIMRQLPSTQVCTIVGSGNAARVRELFGDSPQVDVRGRVDDVADIYRQHDVLLVPLRMGGGSRLKILEGVAHGLLVVSTRVGAEGLPLTPGEDFVLAETTMEWANSLRRLGQEWERFSELPPSAARKLAHLNWPAIGAAFRDVIDERAGQ